jgi:YVTN family beta-propeller protein
MRRGLITRALWVAAALAGLALAPSPGGKALITVARAEDTRSVIRRPVALTLADRGKWLLVLNRRSGTLSVIDTASLKPVNEVRVARKPSDLALTPDGAEVLVADEEAGELVALRRRGPGLDAPRRVKVEPGPVSVRVDADGGRCYVASLWSRRVVVIELGPRAGAGDAADGLRVGKSIPLPFPPRRQLLLTDPTRLVVADAFGGRLAVLDPARGEVESVRAIPAHNIRGLALSGDSRQLLVSHQVLSARATTALNDIHWGNLLTNNLRELPLDGLRNPRADLLTGSCLHHLGDVGGGAGDPAGVAVTPGGPVVIALAGVGAVAVGGTDGEWHRMPVGRGPSAVAVSPDGRRAFVANSFSDSVSVLDLLGARVTAEVALGERAVPTAADRGEELFRDARLSHDGWFSCHSCHTDGHTNGLLADTLGDDSYGTPKRVPSLLGVGDTAPYGWTGRVKDLNTQVGASVETTMRGAKLTPSQEADMQAYLQTLAPPPPLNRFGKPEVEAVRRGEGVFHREGCSACHAPPSYTSARAYDVGLSDENGNREFNPPSLRGTSQAGSYFHDGRACTPAEVFTRHRHRLEVNLGHGDLDDLLAFLADL